VPGVWTTLDRVPNFACLLDHPAQQCLAGAAASTSANDLRDSESSGDFGGKHDLKRFLIFALLGAPLGLVTGLWGILPVLNGSLVDPPVVDYHQIVLLPIAYMIGILPALLVGVLDNALARRGVSRRVLWCALFGFCASFLPLSSAFAMGFLHGPFVLIFGLVGAVPGGVCSWLAGRGGAPAGPAEAGAAGPTGRL
jgi:hypothetical protein